MALARTNGQKLREVKMAAQDTIELVRDGEIATLRINRPERKNALSYSMLDRMAALVRELKTDRGVRVVLFTGAGDTFCAGTDLQELSGRPSPAQATKTPPPPRIIQCATAI